MSYQTPVDNFQQAFLELQRAYFRQNGSGEIVNWARQQAPEVFKAYRQAHQELEAFWEKHREHPPIELAKEAPEKHQTQKLLREWARIQPDAENVIDRLEELEIGGRLWQQILPHLNNLSLELVEKVFSHTKEWKSLTDNPNLTPAGRQRLVLRLSELLSYFGNTYRAGLRSGKRKYTKRRLRRQAQDLLEELIDEHDPTSLFTRESIETLLEGATYTEAAQKQEREYDDIEQRERPNQREADEVLEKIWEKARMLRKEDLLTIITNYRVNSWAARGLVEEYGEDMTEEEWALLAHQTGDYEARKLMVTHPKGHTLPKVREALDDSQGFAVQVGLMRTARGEELHERLGQLLDEEPQDTLDWLRNHKLKHPEDLQPEILLAHIQSEDREQRLQAIMVAAQVSAEPPKAPKPTTRSM